MPALLLQHRPLRLVPAWAALTLWFIAATAGLALLARYASRPGPPARTPAVWPAASSLPRKDGAATLLLFLHPRCPCSHATLAELARAAAWTHEPTQVFVLMHHPAGLPKGWARAGLWARAQEIFPGRVLEDTDGREAALFGAATSGHAFFFDRRGALAFEGGLTISRGHEGDNAGREALVALLKGERPQVRSTPVFGCPLSDVCEAAEASP